MCRNGKKLDMMLSVQMLLLTNGLFTCDAFTLKTICNILRMKADISIAEAQFFFFRSQKCSDKPRFIKIMSSDYQEHNTVLLCSETNSRRP
jgi:hypothetical protein